MIGSLCLHCGAEGDRDLPPGHERGMPCPARGTSPCPTCGQGPGEPCIIIDPLSVNYGNPTRDHAQRPTPSMAVDVLAARTVGNVTDLREYRKEKALRG